MKVEEKKIICPNCGDIIADNPECDAMGIITCEACNEQVIWKSKLEE